MLGLGWTAILGVEIKGASRSCVSRFCELQPRLSRGYGAAQVFSFFFVTIQGYLTYKETHPSEDPTVGLCLGSLGGPRGVGVFVSARYPCTGPMKAVFLFFG